MVAKLRTALGQIHFRLYGALLLLGLVPTVYTAVRIFFLGQLPDPWAFSIAGQLTWVNLLYEILNEAMILPLFYFMGQAKADPKVFGQRVSTGLLICLTACGTLSAVVFAGAETLLGWMAADSSILAQSASYIRIESIAHIFSMLLQFTLVALVTLGKSRCLYILTGAKLLLCILFDAFLVSDLPLSAELGVDGIGYSNLLVNALLLGCSLCLLSREGIRLFAGQDFSWAAAWARSGALSGLESLVRNLAYMVMIARMVNVVGEQGTYWVANNFIWGWLLLPILQLGELIKQEIAADRDRLRRNSLGYFAVTGGILLLWLISIPLWRPFMTHVLGLNDVDQLMKLVLLLSGFYCLYSIQNVCDATFYGLGKIHYMLWESVITNAIYYGTAFALYRTGLWIPTLEGIAWLFGLGMAFDSVVSLLVYRHLLRKEGIRLMD